MKKTAKTHYHIGDKFSILNINGEPRNFLLARTSNCTAALIDLSTGNYWEEPKNVKDIICITECEFNRIAGQKPNEAIFDIRRTHVNNTCSSISHEIDINKLIVGIYSKQYSKQAKA